MAGTAHLTPGELFVYGHATIDEAAWEGDVESPIGAWRGVYLNEADVHVFQVLLGATNEPPSWWIVTENDQGTLAFAAYEDENDYDTVCEGLHKMFAEWHDTDDEPSNEVNDQFVDLSDFVTVPANYEQALDMWNRVALKLNGEPSKFERSFYTYHTPERHTEFVLRALSWGNAHDGFQGGPVAFAFESHVTVNDMTTKTKLAQFVRPVGK